VELKAKKVASDSHSLQSHHFLLEVALQPQLEHEMHKEINLPLSMLPSLLHALEKRSNVSVPLHNSIYISKSRCINIYLVTKIRKTEWNYGRLD
jgi:hypothetical protein